MWPILALLCKVESGAIYEWYYLILAVTFCWRPGLPLTCATSIRKPVPQGRFLQILRLREEPNGRMNDARFAFGLR